MFDSKLVVYGIVGVVPQILEEVMTFGDLPPPPAHLMALSQELEVSTSLSLGFTLG